MSPDYITMRDLVIAYRKTKADLFLNKNCTHRRELLTYEVNLHENLRQLKENIGNVDFFLPPGKRCWTLVGKSLVIDEKKMADADMAKLRTNRREYWDNITKGIKHNKLNAEFRLVEDCPIQFHVFATLWILKIGERLEYELSKYSYGNRIRRLRDKTVNKFGSGTLKPFFNQYDRWRRDAEIAIREGLELGKKIVAMTSDAVGFYHSIDPDFLKETPMLASRRLDLVEDDEIELNGFFADLLKKWAERTPIQDGIGLPVGLTASSVVANIALRNFDNAILKKIKPLHYGRYVDDLIFVFEDDEDFVLNNGKHPTSTQDIWEYICSHSHSLKLEGSECKYNPGTLAFSNIRFDAGKEKCKMFVLEGASGKAFLQTFLRQVNKQSSAWKSMPSLPKTAEATGVAFARIVDERGEDATSFRLIDRLTFQRAAFSQYISSMTNYCWLVAPSDPDWKKRRLEFYDQCHEYVFIPHIFFEFEKYLRDILAIIVYNGDFVDEKSAMLSMLRDLLAIEAALSKCDCKIKGAIKGVFNQNEIINIYSGHVTNVVREAIETIEPVDSILVSKELNQELSKLVNLIDFDTYDDSWNFSDALATAKNLYDADLGYKPYRDNLAKNVSGSSNLVPLSTWKNDVLEIITAAECIERLVKGQSLESDNLHAALVFPTRPCSLDDLIYNMPENLSSENLELLELVSLGHQGFKPNTACFTIEEMKPDAIDSLSPYLYKKWCIANNQRRFKNSRVIVAVVSWKSMTDVEKDKIVVNRSLRDYERFNELLNHIMSVKTTPDYAVFPELSMPPEWFMLAANKLNKSKISLIAGIEYIDESDKVHRRNEVWASFVSVEGPHFSFVRKVPYKQLKRFHAGDEIWLANKEGKCFREPPTPNKNTIIVHGNLCLSLLICSELTNINVVASLRGMIDMLVAPECNQDVKTFDALVSGSAFAGNFFVVQCNDRRYGDSRIYVPSSKEWERDIVRVKGGASDFFVLGELDVNALRGYQEKNEGKGVDPYADKPFKALPSGFRMWDFRKRKL